MDYFSPLPSELQEPAITPPAPNTRFLDKINYIVLDVSDIASFVFENIAQLELVDRTFTDFMKEVINLISDHRLVDSSLSVSRVESDIVCQACKEGPKALAEAQTYATMIEVMVDAVCAQLYIAGIEEKHWHLLNYHAFHNSRLFLTQTQDYGYE